MNLVYHTLTGNARRIAQGVATRIGQEAFPIQEAPPGPFLLVTYTFNRGEVPSGTLTFLAERGEDLRGVVSTGSYHWGANFARAAEVIAEQYRVPIVAQINKSGSNDDLEKIVQWMVEHDAE